MQQVGIGEMVLGPGKLFTSCDTLKLKFGEQPLLTELQQKGLPPLVLLI